MPGVGIGVGLWIDSATAAGPVFPAAVISAGAQQGWNQKTITPASSPPNLAQPWDNTSVNGTQDALPTGWKYANSVDVSGVTALIGSIVNTANGATLDGWDTNGRPIVLKSFTAPTIQNCRIRNRMAYNYPGIGIGILGNAITGPINIIGNDIDGEGEIGGVCRFTASLAVGTLTVTSVDFGVLRVGMRIDTGIAADVSISSLGTGTGGVGTYILSNATQTLSSRLFATRPYMQACIAEHASTYHSGILIQGNRMTGQSDDTIQINSSEAVIENNYIGIGGWNAPLAHWDAIQIQLVLGDTTPIVVRRNFIDATPGVPGVSPSVLTVGKSYGRTSALLASNVPKGVEYSENIFGGAGALVNDETGFSMIYAAYINWGTSGRKINNNVFEWGTAAIFPTNVFDILEFNNNFRLSTGLSVTATKDSAEWLREDDFYWQREDSFTWVKEGLV
jgi:hypothetical protein